MLAIRVDNLSKRYRIGGPPKRYHTLRESLAEAFTAPFRKLAGLVSGPAHQETIWALKDVSFEVAQGEVVGIIGRNGAGKSTLLKILSRITEPTEGRAELHGRVGSLLEVGTGFHLELTGRENIFLNGAILGMKRADIARQFDAIVAFAEVEHFIDTPVKHYSSGMYLRLAFAVAAHLEPEILIVDEVLAVGDAVFQKKCLGKMGDVSRAGRTVLFVSHNMTAIAALCGRCLWLDQGRLIQDGPTGEVVSAYLQAGTTQATERLFPDPAAAPGNDQVRMRAIRIVPERGSAQEIDVTTPFRIEVEYWNLKPGARLNLSMGIDNAEGVRVFTTTTVTEPSWHGRQFPAGLFRSTCQMPGSLLNNGTHSTLILVVEDCARIIFQLEDALAFEIHDSHEDRGNWHGRWAGAVRPRLDWRTELVTAP